MAALGASGGGGGGGGGGMNNLATLIKRLEAATSRLEDIASSSGSIEQQANGSMSAASGAAMAVSDSRPGLPKGGSREASTGTVIRSSHEDDEEQPSPKAPPIDVLPERIEEMDPMMDKEMREYLDASKGLDSPVQEQASGVQKAFGHQRRFLLVSTKCQKPDPSSKTFMDLLSDLQQDMSAVSDVKESNRESEIKEHLAMVGEGMGAFQWLVMDGKPADYVGEVIGGAQLYGNRILKAHKEGDQSHIKYVNTFITLLKALQSYIKKHYLSGVTWNTNGSSDPIQAYRDTDPEASPSTNGAPPTPSSGGAPPPPPPPPPLPVFDNDGPSAAKSTTPSGSTGDMGAVFEQLNRGESVTAGLKKVSKSQMTHKNPSLRAGSSVSDKAATTTPSAASSASDISRARSPGPEIKPKPPSMRQNSSASTQKTASTSATATASSKPPKKELDGNKWLIENFDSPSGPIELDVSLTQSILITRCKNTTIILRGKANAISIDNSPKLQLLVENLVSSVDVIKCNGFAVQITGALPTVLLDQVDGAQIYLSKESLGTEVFTSKCSGVNVVLPPEDEEDDSRECPLPEQMRTVVKGGKLVSEIVEHAG